jgi:hypothetical protein
LPKLRDLTGQRFERLIVLKQEGRKYKKAHLLWLCRCDCGKEKSIDGSSLTSGKTRSCGCLWEEKVIEVGKSNRGKFSRENHINWKGGKWIQKGYTCILRPDHPNARKSGYVFEHVFVMSNHLGRPLLKNETIHHKDGNRSNNDINNLELRLKSAHPPGQSISDLILYWKEMLKRYDKLS